MLDVCLLGTGGMMPLPRRYLTSFLARYNGSSLMIDCGEGTQVAVKSKGWSFKPIDVICFTHYHADHISGLPGMLLTMGNAERTEPLIKKRRSTLFSISERTGNSYWGTGIFCYAVRELRDLHWKAVW